MIIPEPVNLARPYVCADCGCAMRTRGVDGRCIRCMATPTRVCSGYTDEWGDRVGCGRVVQDGGGPVEEATCVACGAAEKRAQAARYAREGRELLERRRKGYGADPDRVDWEGLRRGE